MKSASRDEALEKPHTRAADDPNRFPLEKTPPALTPAEEALVQEKFSTALQSLYEVEVKNARKLKEADMDFGDRSHVIFIHVAAPTLEQIEPVLAAVTKAGKEFPPGSAAAMAFREKADAFVKELQIRPQKLVQRSIHPKTGAIDDTVIQLSADAKFTVNEGSISYEGKSIGGFDMTQSSDHLFRQPLPEAK